MARAARLWGAADAMTEAYGTHLTRAARAIVDYERELGDAQQRWTATWAEAWAEGRRMTSEQAMRTRWTTSSRPGRPAAPEGLTDREVDVLGLVARGMTSADVGQQLFLSPRTVDWHLSSIYTKLGVRSRTEATRFAISHGIG